MTLDTGDLASLIPRLAGHRILVLGDLVLDEYLTGRPARVSREAPVLVLEQTSREYRAGSAGNPAANLVALGSQATIVGVIGADPEGGILRRSLVDLGISCEGLVQAQGLATATKTRILAQGFTGGANGRQQVLRIDRLTRMPPDVAAVCVQRIQRLSTAHDAILLSDYRGGVVEEGTIASAQSAGRLVSVDSQGDLSRFAGADLVKVNQTEAEAALGGQDIFVGCPQLRARLGIRHLVVTLGVEGMALFSDGLTEHIPALNATEVFDVTGAGDTVIAVLTAALVGGVPLAAAARLANAAASLVVRRLGVATVTPTELAGALKAA